MEDTRTMAERCSTSFGCEMNVMTIFQAVGDLKVKGRGDYPRIRFDVMDCWNFLDDVIDFPPRKIRRLLRTLSHIRHLNDVPALVELVKAKAKTVYRVGKWVA